MAHKRKSLRAYPVVISTIGMLVLAGCVYWFARSQHVDYLLELLLFSAMVLLAEVVPTTMPGTHFTITMTMPLTVSLCLSRGAIPVIVFVSFPTFLASLITERNRPIKSLLTLSTFNLATFILSVGAASIAYGLVGGLTLQEAGGLSFLNVVLPLFLWIAVYVVATVILVITGFEDPAEWKVLIFSMLKWCTPSYFFTVPFSLLFAWVYLLYGLPGMMLLILPILAGRNALNLYAEQTNAYRETITTLGSYMQHYHAYTKGHLERVANLADRIARQIGLPVSSMLLIRDAGLLHDIGKVGVDEEVLDKTGQLSDEDWAIIKRHPLRGADILAKMKYLEPLVPWVRSHHERPDGRGYPQGLKEEEIPTEAAIIAVADAYDAMTGGPDEKDRRVYRAPLTLDQAMDQVRLGAGTQFNSRVVKAFMQVMAAEDEGNGDAAQTSLPEEARNA